MPRIKDLKAGDKVYVASMVTSPDAAPKVEVVAIEVASAGKANVTLSAQAGPFGPTKKISRDSPHFPSLLEHATQKGAIQALIKGMMATVETMKADLAAVRANVDVAKAILKEVAAS